MSKRQKNSEMKRTGGPPRNQFLGKTDDSEGKEGTNQHGDDAADECDEVGGGVWVPCYDICDMVGHLYTVLGPNGAKKYPRPDQHNEGGKKQEKIEEAWS